MAAPRQGPPAPDAAADETVPASLIVFSTLTAGAVDALIFLAARVFTANMTGNTVLLGLYTAQGDTGTALHSLLALVCYAIGVGLGVTAVGRTSGAAVPWLGALRATVLEAVFLAGFATASMALASDDGALVVIRVMIACAAVALGIQSATMLRLRLPGLMTTYITGTITALVAGLVERRGIEPGAPPAHHAGSQAMVFATYLGAAFGAALLHAYQPDFVGVLPLATLTVAGTLMTQRLRAR